MVKCLPVHIAKVGKAKAEVAREVTGSPALCIVCRRQKIDWHYHKTDTSEQTPPGWGLRRSHRTNLLHLTPFQHPERIPIVKTLKDSSGSREINSQNLYIDGSSQHKAEPDPAVPSHMRAECLREHWTRNLLMGLLPHGCLCFPFTPQNGNKLR